MASRRDIFYEIREAGYESGRGQPKLSHLSSEEIKLLTAVKKRQVDKYKQLLDKGVNPNIHDDLGISLLHHVAKMSRSPQNGSVTDILATLLHCGADPNATDRWGRTPVYDFIHTSLTNIQKLLEAGACLDNQDHAGQTILMEAVQRKDAEVADVVGLLIKWGCNVHLRDTEGFTALHFICRNHSLALLARAEIAYMLLCAGLSATSEDRQGRIPLCHELERFVDFGHCVQAEDFALVRLLVSGGTAINLSKRRHKETVRHCIHFLEASFNQLLDAVSPVMHHHVFQQLLAILREASNQMGYTPAMKQYLQTEAVTVFSLKAYCRLAIRKLFKGKVFYRTATLPLPESLKSYICNLDNNFANYSRKIC